VLDVLEDEWSSARIVGDTHSALMDLPLTFKQGDLLPLLHGMTTNGALATGWQK
jgi:hypothetical protein